MIKYILAIVILFGSCIRDNKIYDEYENLPKVKIDNYKSINDLTILKIDGCEYIGRIRGSNMNILESLTHKGNCKFCVARNSVIKLK